jgi:phosphate transport system permease protein
MTDSAGAIAETGAHPASVFARSRPRYGELLIRIFLVVAALITVLTTVGIVFALFSETISFLNEVPLQDFLFGTDWAPLFHPPSYGVIPLVTGTLLTSFIGLLVGVPLGIGSAIFLSEYASRRTRNFFKPVLETLAGVPTVVFGYFALTAVTPWLRSIGIEVSVFNALSAGLVIGVLIVPTIASISEDALSAVPSGLREASFGLGASRLQTSVRVVVPAAVSGIVAGVVLGASRAIGETMVVLLAAGQQPNLTADVREPVETMATFIAATGKGDIPTGSLDYKTIFAVGALLFVMTFALNMISTYIVNKYREEYE